MKKPPPKAAAVKNLPPIKAVAAAVKNLPPIKAVAAAVKNLPPTKAVAAAVKNLPPTKAAAKLRQPIVHLLRVNKVAPITTSDSTTADLSPREINPPKTF